MKKFLLVLLIGALLVGCTTDSSMLIRQNELEERIARLEQGPRAVGPVVDKEILAKLAETGEAVRIRGFTCTTGGTAGCLDAYPEDLLVAGDLGMVFESTSNVITFHIFDDADPADESDPEYIWPDDRDGTQVWKLFSGFRYMPGTTSSINFRDINNSNIQEVIVKLEANATDTGDGTEDADYTISVIGAGALRDYIVIDGDAGLKLLLRSDQTWIATDSYTGMVLPDYDATENINQWDLVYYDESDNGWARADGDETAGGNNWPARGMAVECPNNDWPCQLGEQMYVLVFGKIRYDTWNWTNYGEDGALYLGNDPGEILSAADAAAQLATTGDCWQTVGWAIDSDTIFLQPTPHWLEVE